MTRSIHLPLCAEECAHPVYHNILHENSLHKIKHKFLLLLLGGNNLHQNASLESMKAEAAMTEHTRTHANTSTILLRLLKGKKQDILLLIWQIIYHFGKYLNNVTAKYLHAMQTYLLISQALRCPHPTCYNFVIMSIQRVSGILIAYFHKLRNRTRKSTFTCFYYANHLDNWTALGSGVERINPPSQPRDACLLNVTWVELIYSSYSNLILPSFAERRWSICEVRKLACHVFHFNNREANIVDKWVDTVRLLNSSRDNTWKHKNSRMTDYLHLTIIKCILLSGFHLLNAKMRSMCESETKGS